MPVISEEIVRLQGAKADIKAAIEGKGVSVPSSALLDEYAPYIEAIEGGGSQGFTKSSAIGTGGQATLQFSVLGEPKAFVVTAQGYGVGVLTIVGDSTGCRGIYAAASTYQHNFSTGFSSSYSGGILTITPPSGVTFIEEDYSIVYYYGSGTLTFKSSTVTPGSGVTAVTFTGTGLTEIPAMYACLLETQVNSEQYRRVALYTNSSWWNDYKPLGLTFFSQQVADTTSSFTASYNNGLYINSGGQNAGGYFHNPGTYTLYYLMASDVGGEPGPNLQDKTISPSTSQQSVTADEEYDGLGTVTIGAVTSAIDADIVAGNIKKDVNILGVVGTYEGSGGGSTLTPTAGDYPVVGNGGLGGGGSNLTSTGISVTIPVTGTYRFKWCAFRRNNSTSYSWSSRLYRTRSGQTTAIGTENSTWTSTYIQENSQDIACNAGDVITVYVRGRSNTYSWGGMLTACVAQKLWTN